MPLAARLHTTKSLAEDVAFILALERAGSFVFQHSVFIFDNKFLKGALYDLLTEPRRGNQLVGCRVHHVSAMKAYGRGKSWTKEVIFAVVNYGNLAFQLIGSPNEGDLAAELLLLPQAARQYANKQLAFCRQFLNRLGPPPLSVFPFFGRN